MKEIRKNIDSPITNSFNLINPKCVTKIINNLDTSKTTQQGDITTKITKLNKDLFPYFTSASFNNGRNKSIFPDEIKHADTKPQRIKK